MQLLLNPALLLGLGVLGVLVFLVLAFFVFPRRFVRDLPGRPTARRGRPIEQHPRRLVRGPGPGRQELLQLSGGRGELAVAVGPPDLDGVLVLRLPALSVPGQARGVRDLQLVGQIGDDRRGDVQGVGQEGAQEPDGAELHREAQAVVLAAVPVDEVAIGVVQEEEALQLRPGERLGVSAVRSGLVVGEELDRHAA